MIAKNDFKRIERPGYGGDFTPNYNAETMPCIYGYNGFGNYGSWGGSLSSAVRSVGGIFSSAGKVALTTVKDLSKATTGALVSIGGVTGTLGTLYGTKGIFEFTKQGTRVFKPLSKIPGASIIGSAVGRAGTVTTKVADRAVGLVSTVATDLSKGNVIKAVAEASNPVAIGVQMTTDNQRIVDIAKSTQAISSPAISNPVMKRNVEAGYIAAGAVATAIYAPASLFTTAGKVVGTGTSVLKTASALTSGAKKPAAPTQPVLVQQAEQAAPQGDSMIPLIIAGIAAKLLIFS